MYQNVLERPKFAVFLSDAIPSLLDLFFSSLVLMQEISGGGVNSQTGKRTYKYFRIEYSSQVCKYTFLGFFYPIWAVVFDCRTFIPYPQKLLDVKRPLNVIHLSIIFISRIISNIIPHILSNIPLSFHPGYFAQTWNINTLFLKSGLFISSFFAPPPIIFFVS